MVIILIFLREGAQPERAGCLDVALRSPVPASYVVDRTTGHLVLTSEKSVKT